MCHERRKSGSEEKLRLTIEFVYDCESDAWSYEIWIAGRMVIVEKKNDFILTYHAAKRKLLELQKRATNLHHRLTYRQDVLDGTIEPSGGGVSS